jgi:hypothetical protein
MRYLPYSACKIKSELLRLTYKDLQIQTQEC